MPTKSRLFQKGAVQSNICPVCNNDIETSLHALVTCEVAREVCVALSIRWFHGNVENFKSWLQIILSRVNRVQWSQVSAICKGLCVSVSPSQMHCTSSY